VQLGGHGDHLALPGGGGEQGHLRRLDASDLEYLVSIVHHGPQVILGPFLGNVDLSVHDLRQQGRGNQVLVAGGLPQLLGGVRGDGHHQRDEQVQDALDGGGVASTSSLIPAQVVESLEIDLVGHGAQVVGPHHLLDPLNAGGHAGYHPAVRVAARPVQGHEVQERPFHLLGAGGVPLHGLVVPIDVGEGGGDVRVVQPEGVHPELLRRARDWLGATLGLGDLPSLPHHPPVDEYPAGPHLLGEERHMVHQEGREVHGEMLLSTQVEVQGVPVMHIVPDLFQRGGIDTGGRGDLDRLALVQDDVVEERLGHLLGLDRTVVGELGYGVVYRI